MKICSVCNNVIPGQDTFQKIYICPHCGWVESQSSKLYEAKTHRQYIIVSTLLALIIITGFIQSVKWGSSAFEVMPLKLKSVIGTADAQDYRRLGEICESRHNPKCMEKSHRKWTELYSSNDKAALEALSYLSRSLIFNRKLEEASQSLERYFTLGGTDTEMAFYYARTLSQQNNIETSIKYFKYVLKQKPKVLQISVLRAYVSALVKHNKLAQARDVILKLQKTKKYGFMNRELRAIKIELLAKK